MKYKRLGDDRGLILPLALMAFVVLGALAAAILSIGGSEAQIASNHLRAIQAQFLAEAGLEHAFNRLNTLWTASHANLTTNAGSLQPIPGIVANTPLGGAGNYTVQYQAAGLWTWRVVSTGSSAIVGPLQTQQIRRAIMSTSFSSKDAIVTNGTLTIGGSTDVSSTNGQCGNVHANGDLTLGGNAHIHGDATASQTYAQTGNPTVDGVKGGNKPTETVPHIDPADFLTAAKASLSAGNIFQMKADGKVQDGNGGQLADLVVAGGNFCGWSYTSGTPLAQWTFSGTPCNGTFYFEGNATVTGSPGSITTPWKTTLIATGDIDIQGKPTIQADATYTVHDTLFISGRDVQINGTPSNGYNGLIAAHEQFSLSGNGTFTGFVIGENASNTPGSLVNSNTNTVSGNIGLTYDCGSNPPLQGPLQILSWGL